MHQALLDRFEIKIIILTSDLAWLWLKRQYKSSFMSKKNPTKDFWLSLGFLEPNDLDDEPVNIEPEQGEQGAPVCSLSGEESVLYSPEESDVDFTKSAMFDMDKLRASLPNNTKFRKKLYKSALLQTESQVDRKITECV